MSRTSQIVVERRMGAVFAVFTVLAAVVVLRLVNLQIVGAERYREAVRESRTRSFVLPARRGDILDRNGTPLARTVDTYALFVRPSVFRETNGVDALGDLATAWLGRTPGKIGAAVGLDEAVRKRSEDWHLVFNERLLWADRLAALALDDKSFGKEAVAPARDLLAPQGSLLLPPSALPLRLRRALLALADRNVVATLEVLRRRLAAEPTLGHAIGRSGAEIAAAIEAEASDIDRLAKAVGRGPDDLLHDIFEGESREMRSVERALDDHIDDRIAVQTFGTYDLETLERSSLLALAQDLSVPSEDAARVGRGYDALLAVDPEALGAAERVAHAELIAAVEGVRRARALPLLEGFEVASIARLLGIWNDDPRALKRALGLKRRAEDDYRRADYISTEKEWVRRLQFKGSYTQELAGSCSFETAEGVWSPFGLGKIGFEVAANLGREYWENERGCASLLIGRVNKLGAAFGGMEKTFAPPVPLGLGLVGVDGSVRKIQEPDESWRPLADAVAPRHGATVTLTLDAPLQKEAEEILERMIRELGVRGDPSVGAGAAIIDIASGDILALASAPRTPSDRYVDDYLLADRIRQDLDAAMILRRLGRIGPSELGDEIVRLREEKDRKPFVERAADAGQHFYYPPGSTMKCFGALLGLEAGVIAPSTTFACEGDSPFHGTVDLHDALGVSCNHYFQTVGQKIGTKRLLEWYRRFGLMQDIPWLVSRDSADRRFGACLGDGVRNTAIGQGSISTSPLEVASMMAVLGRGGRVLGPRIVRAVDKVEVAPLDGGSIGCASGNVRFVVQAMEGVVQRLAIREKRLQKYAALKIAGKTGTAEGYVGRHQEENCSWFAGFAPADAPRFAVAVFCEHTNDKGRAVSPYAAMLFEAAVKRMTP